MFFMRVSMHSRPPSFWQYLFVSMSSFEKRMLRKTFFMPSSMPLLVFFSIAMILARFPTLSFGVLMLEKGFGKRKLLTKVLYHTNLMFQGFPGAIPEPSQGPPSSAARLSSTPALPYPEDPRPTYDKYLCGYVERKGSTSTKRGLVTDLRSTSFVYVLIIRRRRRIITIRRPFCVPCDTKEPIMA